MPFVGCIVWLCDFHREQAWHRWLISSNNGMKDHKVAATNFLRNIADSESENEFEENVKILKASDIWKMKSAEPFRNWIQKTWLPVHKVSSLFLI